MESKRGCNVPECLREHVARGYCKLHYRRFMKYGDPLGSTPAPEAIDIGGLRTCTRCKAPKPIEEFGPDSRCRGGRKRICRTCLSTYSRAWQIANKDQWEEGRRIARIRRVFGEDGLNVDRRRQAGAGCDICGQRTIRMAIDHSHLTGRVRGLLCKDCNLILGWVQDDPARLRAMADYVSL